MKAEIERKKQRCCMNCGAITDNKHLCDGCDSDLAEWQRENFPSLREEGRSFGYGESYAERNT